MSEKKRRETTYVERAGVTTKPIATTKVTSMQVLHALLRVFDNFMKVVIHSIAGVYIWSETNANEKKFVKKAHEDLQKVIKQQLCVAWDYADSGGKGGTTTSGNVARVLLLKRKIGIS